MAAVLTVAPLSNALAQSSSSDLGFADSTICVPDTIDIPQVLKDAPGGDQGELPTNIEADEIEAISDSVIQLSGNAEVIQGSRGVFADLITYNQETYTAKAEGNVTFYTENENIATIFTSSREERYRKNNDVIGFVFDIINESKTVVSFITVVSNSIENHHKGIEEAKKLSLKGVIKSKHFFEEMDSKREKKEKRIAIETGIDKYTYHDRPDGDVYYPSDIKIIRKKRKKRKKIIVDID